MWSMSSMSVTPVVVIEETVSKVASKKESYDPEKYSGIAAMTPKTIQALAARRYERLLSKRKRGQSCNNEPKAKQHATPKRKLTTHAVSLNKTAITVGTNIKAAKTYNKMPK